MQLGADGLEHRLTNRIVAPVKNVLELVRPSDNFPSVTRLRTWCKRCTSTDTARRYPGPPPYGCESVGGNRARAALARASCVRHGLLAAALKFDSEFDVDYDAGDLEAILQQ